MSNQLSEAEQKIEQLARTVTCPVCGSLPGKQCRSNDKRKDGQRSHMYSSHLGRLQLARKS